MKLNTLRRTSAAAAVLTLSFGLAACGSDDSDATGTDTPSSSAAGGDTSDAGAQTFGDGCKDIPTDGKGSFDGMVQDPVATAASNNPLLSTLVAAVGAAGLGDTLNSAEGLTVFAPYNGAFDELGDTVTTLVDGATKADDPTTSPLAQILSHHVIAGQLDPAAVVGDQTTLLGDKLTISGDESGMTVSDGKVEATVLCGNIPTANATVYVIDKVLTNAAVTE